MDPVSKDAEPQAAPEATPAPSAPPKAAADEPKVFDESYVKDLRAESAKYRVEAKELADRLKQIEDAQKTEAEKLAERAASAESRLADVTNRLARVEACTAAGLDPQYAARLQGDSPEELAADAKQFAGLLGSQAAPSFDGGARPNPPKPTIDQQIAEAEAKGDWDTHGRLSAQKLYDLSNQAAGA